jgi:hypothetical protein
LINQIEEQNLSNLETSATRLMGATAILIPVLFSVGLLIIPKENREQLELAIPIVAIAFAFTLGFMFRNAESSSWRITINITSTLIVGWQLSIVGEGNFPYLWNGFGFSVVLLTIVFVGIYVVIQQPIIEGVLTKSESKIKYAKSILVITVIGVYLPSLIQPPWGIINIGDATHQVLEEISGPLVGHFPGVNFVATYTTLLGAPLIPLRWFPIGPSTKMILVLLWTNLLVVAVPGFMMLSIRSIMVKKSRLLPLLVVIMPLMVSGNWGAASTLGESLSGLPGRTLMPVILGYLLLQFLVSDGTKQTTIKGLVVGLFSFLVAANNIEFGAPALVSFLAVIISMVLIDTRRKIVLSALLGVVLGGLLYAIYSLMISGPYDFGFRIGSYAGKPYSPAEIFPIMSIHNVFLAIFVTGITVGLRKMRVLSKNPEAIASHKSYLAPVCAVYFGTWGILSFPYCSYRCVEGLYMSTQLYLVPAILCSASLVVMSSPSLKFGQNQTRRTTWGVTPVLFITLFSFATIVQAPNPFDEWKRVFGGASVDQWASDERRGKADQWNSTKIDWIKVDSITGVADLLGDSSFGYFGYMGNSVELATGINNLTRINSGEVLAIKGTDQLRKFACVEVEQIKPELIIVIGLEFPCRGYVISTKYQSLPDGLAIYEKM